MRSVQSVEIVLSTVGSGWSGGQIHLDILCRHARVWYCWHIMSDSGTLSSRRSACCRLLWVQA